MQTIKLPATDISASILGFGCSALFGEKSSAEALRLLETAYEAGIIYFDAARVYGYGAAEAVLGEFARGKRERVVIASKFGIRPWTSIARDGQVRRAVGALMRLSPRLRNFLGRQARGAVKTGTFNVADAQASLEVSLRTLGTDYIDIFFLHDCGANDPSEELLSFLEKARSNGQIRYFGVASGIDQILAIRRQFPEFLRIAQFENSVLRRNVELVAEHPGAIITHGALAGSLAALRKHLSENAQLSRKWSSKLQIDFRQPDELVALMLAWAVKANRKGPVLFRSSHVRSIRSNAATIVDQRFSPDQIDEFAILVEKVGIHPV